MFGSQVLGDAMWTRNHIRSEMGILPVQSEHHDHNQVSYW